MSSEDGLEDLLVYLKATRGFDFTGYKRATLERRISKRMAEVGVAGYTDYLDHLEVHTDEFAQLFDTILINVTGFFRDKPTWDYLAQEALPELLEQKDARSLIRVWTAGCASGEEAYTIAIVLAEALGEDDFVKRVKVYATDVDEDALTTARHGVYQEKDLQPLSDELRSRYFEPVGSRFAFKRSLRQAVIFGRHDLVQDPPISRLDLLVCRNTLMYFNVDLQGRILKNFHFALADKGLLFLGKAETLLSHGELFAPVDLRHRVFTRVSQSPLRDRILGIPVRADADDPPAVRHMHLREAAVDVTPVAQIVIDVEGLLVLANEEARSAFNLAVQDFGRPIADFEVSYRPLELRPHIESAYADRRPVVVNNVDRRRGNGDAQSFDVTVAPVFDSDGSPLGVTVSFTDVTIYRQLRRELEQSAHDLETAYGELQSTNEELETTNEELQSTVEELETTNEELQSANEELETTNEELQSTNAEIQAMNEDMRRRTAEQNQIIAFSRSVIDTLHVAVTVVDREFRVRAWNDRAHELWGLRAEEVEGVAWTDLDIGLPVDEIEEAIGRCLKGESQRMTIGAHDRRGGEFECRVSCNPLIDPEGVLQGAVILTEDLAS